VSYVRLSIMKPRRGDEARVNELLAKLNEASRGHPGFEQGLVLRPHDDSGEIARIAIYRDEASAEAVANTDRVLALRSELHLDVEPGHIERAFFAD